MNTAALLAELTAAIKAMVRLKASSMLLDESDAAELADGIAEGAKQILGLTLPMIEGAYNDAASIAASTKIAQTTWTCQKCGATNRGANSSEDEA